MTREILNAILWLGVGIVFAVAEGLTVQLVAIWFALAAIAAAIASALGFAFSVQLAVFVVVSALLLLAMRPLVRGKLTVQKQSTNADRVIGQQGVVVRDIDSAAEEGRIHVDGLDWAARTEGGENIAEGEKVKVLAIDGVKLVVKRAEKTGGSVL